MGALGSARAVADAVATLSDVDLVDRVRHGDTEAYRELWNRHHAAGLSLAAKVTRRYDPEDLVQEAFARILSAMSRGGGPDVAFRAYLYAAIRNVSMNWVRDEPECQSLDGLDEVADPESIFDDAVLDRTITGRAFSGLRPEWRTVLWYTAVEGLPPREVGQFLGMSANGAAVLAYRAREGLRAAWIQAHVATDGFEQACQWSVERLGAYKRGRLCAADTDRLEDHLTNCLHCSILVEELDGVADRLPAVLVPLVLGYGLAEAAEGTDWSLFFGAQPAQAGGATSTLGAVGGLAARTVAGSTKAATVVLLATVLALGGSTAWTLRHLPGQDADLKATGHSASSAHPHASAPGDVPQETATRGPDPDEPGGDDPDLAEEAHPGADADTGGENAQPAIDAAAPVVGGTNPAPTGPRPAPADPEPLPPADDGGDDDVEEPIPPQPDPPPVAPPAPRVNGVTQSLYLPEMYGTAEPGADVIAEAGGITLARTTADATGAWTATLAFDTVPADPIAVDVYQEVDGRRSAAAPLADRIDLQTPTVVGIATTPTPTVTFTGLPGTVVHVAVDGLVTSHNHTLGDQPIARHLVGLSPGPHTVAVRYADPSTGRYGAWTRTEFTIW